MTKDKILVVEDDLAIARGIIYNLEYEGYDVRHAAHGCAVMPIVGEFAPDLIVLDLMLPGRSGFDILRDLRHDRNDVYVIILSARTDEADKVEGLNLGADDYIAKPFALREFLARIASAMRRIRRQKQDDCMWRFDDISRRYVGNARRSADQAHASGMRIARFFCKTSESDVFARCAHRQYLGR